MKAIIPAAGLGTRFLPGTKCTPKEMLPVLDKPVIQYVVEEALAEGRDLPDEVSEFSLEWGELAETLAGNRDREAIHQAVRDELGSVCYRILGNTAVFKQKATTQTFLESLGFAAR